jgi:hypothetical protein
MNLSQRNQQGSILITIMVAMVFAMGLAATLTEHFVVSEDHEVSELLAKEQVYLAMSGIADYVLSRAAYYSSTYQACYNGSNHDTCITTNLNSKISDFPSNSTFYDDMFAFLRGELEGMANTLVIDYNFTSSGNYHVYSLASNLAFEFTFLNNSSSTNWLNNGIERSLEINLRSNVTIPISGLQGLIVNFCVPDEVGIGTCSNAGVPTSPRILEFRRTL